MIETWKDIPGYEGFYQASDLGNIRRLDSIGTGTRNRPLRRKGRVLRAGINSCGYYSVVLSKHGNQISWKVHRLVMMSFVSVDNNKTHINHKNGVKTDNSLNNLEWCTNRENAIHAVDAGLKKTKLDREKVLFILHNKHLGKKALALMFGVNPPAIDKVWYGQRWKRVYMEYKQRGYSLSRLAKT